MLDHIVLTVSNLKCSLDFYSKALSPLGITNYVDYDGTGEHPDLKGFGDGERAFFWLKQGVPNSEAVHFAFVAKTRAEVESFYDAAMAAGATDNDSPRARLEYDPGYYAAYVLDPDGYNVEVVHKS